jgi:heat shock protein HtpX
VALFSLVSSLLFNGIIASDNMKTSKKPLPKTNAKKAAKSGTKTHWHLLFAWIGRELGLTGDLGLEAVRRNRLWLSLMTLSLTIAVSGYHLNGRMGLLIGFFIAVGLNLLVAFYDEWRLMALFPASELEGQDPWSILKLTREVSRQIQTQLLTQSQTQSQQQTAADERTRATLPSVWLVKSPTPFIFSAGLLPSRLKVFISSGLISRLSEAEIRALLTHELLKSKTGLTQITTAAAAIADVWMLAASWADYLITCRFIFALLRQKSDQKRDQTNDLKRVYFGPFTWILFPLLAGFLRLVIHRKTILKIDRMTASDFGQLDAFVSALVKLDSYGKNLPLNVNLVEAALFSVDPLASYSWSNWASVQPSIESRTVALTGHFPL